MNPPRIVIPSTDPTRLLPRRRAEMAREEEVRRRRSARLAAFMEQEPKRSVLKKVFGLLREDS